MKAVFELTKTFRVDGLPDFIDRQLYETEQAAEKAKQNYVRSLDLIPTLNSEEWMEPRNPDTMTRGLYKASITSKEVVS